MQEQTGLTKEEQQLLRRLLAKQAALDAQTPYHEQWLAHPNRQVQTVIGPLPKLVKATSDRMYRDMISDGWVPAEQSMLDAYQEMIDIPGNVLAEEASRIKAKKAEQAVLEYYGKLDPDEVPDQWREKLDALKAKKQEKSNGTRSRGKSAEAAEE